MENKLFYDSEDRKNILSEMLSEQVDYQSQLLSDMLDVRLEISRAQERIELLRFYMNHGG